LGPHIKPTSLSAKKGKKDPEKKSDFKKVLKDLGYRIDNSFASANWPMSPAKIDDFHLQYWILKRNAKNMIEEGVLGKWFGDNTCH